MDIAVNEEVGKVKKIKTVIVKTAMGDKVITMVPFTIDRTKNLVDVLCTSSCPYSKVCGKIRHPEKLGDEKLTLTDWCLDRSFVGEKENKELSDLSNYYPQEGEIEKLYPEGHDSLKQLIGQRQLINISEFIDKVCPGFCDKYNKDHSNCSFNNPICICKELFIGREEPLVLNANNESLSTEDKENEDS